MGHNEPIRRASSNSEIPDKLYFRIGDVAKLCEVPPYVLRFWESEFPQLKPNKGGTGQRLYRRKDVETALTIKRLLYDEGYTIPGARQILKQEQQRSGPPQLALAIAPPTGPAIKDKRRLEAVRKQLQELHALLSGSVIERGEMTRSLLPAATHLPAKHRITLTARVPAPAMDDLFDSPVLQPDRISD